MKHIFADVLVFMMNCGLIYVYINLSHKFHWFDKPDEERKLHSISIPTSAGMIFMFPLIIFLFIYPVFGSIYSLYISICLATLLIVGSIDDFKGISVKFRLLVITLIASGMMFAIAGRDDVSVFTLFIYFIGIIWWMNLYNFMDGANGMAALHAIVTLAGYISVYILFADNDSGLISYLVLFLICVFSFLLFNFPKARVFMGDSGSLSVSFLLAVTALYGIINNIFDEVLVISFHLTFIVDATLTLFVRLSFGHKISKAHNLHYFQSLVKMMSSHSKVSSLYAFVTLCNVLITLIAYYLHLSLMVRIFILLIQTAILSTFWINFSQKTKFERFRT